MVVTIIENKKNPILLSMGFFVSCETINKQHVKFLAVMEGYVVRHHHLILA